MGILVYMSSVSSSKEIKKQQQKIEMILTSKKIATEYVDISSSAESKTKMRDGCGDSAALPPQIFNGDQHCGDFAAFDEAVENGTLNEFLKL